MKLLPLLAILLIATATTQAQSSLHSTWMSLKDSPLSLSYSAVTYTSRDDDKKIQGMDLLHDLALSYSFTDNDQFRVLNEFSNPYGGPSSYDITELRYQRANLWTEQSGSWADVNFQQRYVYNNDRSKSFGKSSSRVYANSTLGKDLVLKNILRYDVVHKESATDLGDSFWMLYSTPTWKLNDKWSVGLTFEYTHRNNNDLTVEKPNPTDALELGPSALYTISDTQYLNLAAYIQTMQSGDGEAFVKDASDGIAYELVYGITVF